MAANESRVLGTPLERLSDTPTSAPVGLTVGKAADADKRGMSWPISGDAMTAALNEGATK